MRKAAPRTTARRLSFFMVSSLRSEKREYDNIHGCCLTQIKSHQLRDRCFCERVIFSGALAKGLDRTAPIFIFFVINRWAKFRHQWCFWRTV